MQQVTVDSRFWWRALDAHLPAEPRSAPATFAPAVTAPALQPVKPVAPVPFKLEVPQGERRARRARAKSANASRMFAAAAMLLACTAGAGAALVTGAIEPQRIQIVMSNEAEQMMLRLGFGIEQVSLSGYHYTADTDVYDALGLAAIRTFADFDAPAALKRIEMLPWVERAQITRMFPGALRVELRERRPAALWSLKGRNYLIDGTGRVLGAAEPQGWRLPHIAGEGANTDASLLFTALGRHPEIASVVARAERIGGRRWSLVLANGSRLELGADREVEGLEQIARIADLRRALSGPAMIAAVRTAVRLTIRHAALTGERKP